MLVVNAGNIAKDWEWLSGHLPDGVKLTNRSDEIALLAVQGPHSLPMLQKLTPIDLSLIPYYHFCKGTIAGIPMIISRQDTPGNLVLNCTWNRLMMPPKAYGIRSLRQEKSITSSRSDLVREIR